MVKDIKSMLQGVCAYGETSDALKQIKYERQRMQNEMTSFRRSLKDVKQIIKGLKIQNRDALLKTCGGVLHDCGDLKGKGCASGMYRLHPKGESPFKGYCDMNANGGGWTVIQRRQDGSTNFYRGWEDYKNGFGDPTGEFWLGNEHLYKLTSKGRYRLRVHLQDWSGSTRYATYNTFKLGNEGSGYKLTIGSYSGNAGDSMSYSNAAQFSTKDKGSTSSCAKRTFGAWWYKTCTHSNLNGEYLRGKTSGKDIYRGVSWYHWKGWNNSLRKSTMMIRKY
ncbi:Ryncolin-4,Angiopoietin-related protein 7,Angiopoietin-related protein 1,Ficolin-3,Ficolin-1-B,Techylectin-5A,Ficolin-2,Ryncolin-1,Tenascin-R,Protein scabrous,Fibrinogen-like protein 1,Angiopoietin-1,Tenascin-X,Fibrinogen C domain-containing protein 1-A,Ryncolin-3,Tenascin,Fibrinogen C domain-containing protein 1,Ryncolin-2,Angiopoietin-related protein 6,Techylectin-5B,Angiopoietin-related protein 2,Angiopoietin-2,Microfibril-associated glycoprotein 4,Fibrinogen alpha chain,Ficolin-1-A,Ficolin-1,Techylecti|uniref:Fibrinogen C-terminal domain-containing protein n=1 Tax=Mytilus coruscus TaxID=42192 RepID=A0A6J7ZXM6_MYTCO|nr:Ryncolin-4,Angiopoietin-related protein 7,Angiopoietin-related protein 1,Ficolin-3,Ficolin-1-B,Techylectin-5A,Ficolin-2,Ryncolin-1,Tenascin-R,Protein scabrous,Fibrinogen-like protein 1,Angiopoietin-1,Tenascin-X,Fibrinogen C domain-containing protein 1-A,Ryncolin-3,Tenascin,Fibrinogen C domain-containing protein 1,Ryncolin-2,Angiopoietin-related protein 6,Techylectin-5B,Angiopoietin-related protein 2,Angiopoietin-2,Microfibril-associated glycoprotein 4,Fibrinogen alpha chain,Ficolin-1-A,Ficolin-1